MIIKKGRNIQRYTMQLSISVTSEKLIVTRCEKCDVLHLCLLQITLSDLSEIRASKWASVLICIITLLDKDHPPLLGFSFTEKSCATYIIAFVTYVYAQRWLGLIREQWAYKERLNPQKCPIVTAQLHRPSISLSITLKATLWHGSWLDECPYGSAAHYR